MECTLSAYDRSRNPWTVECLKLSLKERCSLEFETHEICRLGTCSWCMGKPQIQKVDILDRETVSFETMVRPLYKREVYFPTEGTAFKLL